MAKNDRSGVNPFTGKKHFDIINDDQFLKQSSNEYYSVIYKAQLLDNTPQGQIVRSVALKLINAVQEYLTKIDRLDYIQDYYEWDVHLVGDNTVNAFCMPGGKIIMFSGILSVANTEEKIAFILGHEMAHALLDHSRTRASAQTAHNAITSVAWIGSLAMDLFGLGAIGALTRAATNVASAGSQFFLLNPWGRDQELEADRLGMMIIHWAGYDISQIPAFWESMSTKNSNEHDFFSIHPADSKRIAGMKDLIAEIEGDNDFYSKPVIGNPSVPKNDSAPQDANAIVCPICGAPLEADSKFCSNCGAKFEVGLKCAKCGSPVEKGDEFCTNCGNKL